MSHRVLRTSSYISARRALSRPSIQQTRRFVNGVETRDRDDGTRTHVDIDALLAEPTWSVSSLLPPEKQTDDAPKISRKQLHHLLRLSALPSPASLEEEDKMLATLQSQLHFVREIQKADTTGVQPLTSLRDETLQGEKETELDLDALADALNAEEVRGRFHQRIRRKNGLVAPQGDDGEEWDVLGCAEKKVGRYFLVEGGKD